MSRRVHKGRDELDVAEMLQETKIQWRNHIVNARVLKRIHVAQARAMRKHEGKSQEVSECCGMNEKYNRPRETESLHTDARCTVRIDVARNVITTAYLLPHIIHRRVN